MLTILENILEKHKSQNSFLKKTQKFKPNINQMQNLKNYSEKTTKSKYFHRLICVDLDSDEKSLFSKFAIISYKTIYECKTFYSAN